MTKRAERVQLSCVACGTTFERPVYRLHGNRGRFCSLPCLGRWRRDRHLRACEQCGEQFWVRFSRVKAGYGRFCSKRCYGDNAASRPMTRRVEARPGDQRQAVRRIREMVIRRIIPHANELPCVDCGHVWTRGGLRHEYDHYLGYETAEQHESVQVVCSKCHRQRTNERQLQAAFVAGWLAGIRGDLVLADKWLKWVENG